MKSEMARNREESRERGGERTQRIAGLQEGKVAKQGEAELTLTVRRLVCGI